MLDVLQASTIFLSDEVANILHFQYTNHEQDFDFITLVIEINDLIHKIYGIKET